MILQKSPYTDLLRKTSSTYDDDAYFSGTRNAFFRINKWKQHLCKTEIFCNKCLYCNCTSDQFNASSLNKTISYMKKK